MKDIIGNITTEIIANIISALMFVALVWLIYLGVFIRERQRLLKVFGLSRKFPNLKVLVSRIEVKAGGSIPAEGEKIIKGYVGPAISKPEYDGALLLYKKIEPGWLAVIPRRIRDWLSKKYISFVRLEPTIDVAPQNVDEIPETNLILIGSNIYNVATKYYLHHPSCAFKFTIYNNERVIMLCRYGMEDVIIPGRSKNRELGIIQRVRDAKFGFSVIICAGLGAEATYGCARYLADHLVELESKYRDKDFGICLAFEQRGIDAIAQSTPRVIDEIIIEEAIA